MKVSTEEIVNSFRCHPSRWHREMAEWASKMPRCKCGKIANAIPKVFANARGEITVIYKCPSCKREARVNIFRPPRTEEFMHTIYP
ncbi:MAG: hypothetical protein DRO11_09210 [Methanobacteriota archaeon]|nr:MAG: hypothetical protein DRO11_09210 [Euryarchaeota archaeon]